MHMLLTVLTFRLSLLSFVPAIMSAAVGFKYFSFHYLPFSPLYILRTTLISKVLPSRSLLHHHIQHFFICYQSSHCSLLQYNQSLKERYSGGQLCFRFCQNACPSLSINFGNGHNISRHGLFGQTSDSSTSAKSSSLTRLRRLDESFHPRSSYRSVSHWSSIASRYHLLPLQMSSSGS